MKRRQIQKSTNKLLRILLDKNYIQLKNERE
jgi:hypothetical protein